jgi:hypothetical protein
MKSRNCLLHPVFLISLVVLIINDQYLKYQYSNWLTGKLSDVAGLIVLPLFLATLTRHKQAAFIFSGVFFTWWKSPLSVSLLMKLNEARIPVGRVEDPTDLWALAILPLVYLVPARTWSLPVQKIASWSAGALCIFAFCRTSAIRHAQHEPRENEIYFRENFKSRLTGEQVLQKLDRLGISWLEDSIRYYPMDNNKPYYLRVRTDSTPQWKELRTKGDTTLYLQMPGKFYSIRELVIEGDTVRNIEFYINPTPTSRKPTQVHVESFRMQNGPLTWSYSSSGRPKRYKKYFKKLFKE